MKTQILYIHGGMTHKNKANYIQFLQIRPLSLQQRNYRCNAYLKNEVGDFFDIVIPTMPCKDFAQYDEWIIQLERHLEMLNDNIILIGSSLGGICLAKYLSENKLNKKILKSYIICPPFDDTIQGEDLAGGFELGDDLSMIMTNSPKTVFMFSKDDPIIPISHADKYKKALPHAEYIIYESKNGHFVIDEFPEIVEMLKKDIKDIKEL